MCGRYVSPDSAAIERQWRLRGAAGLALPARFNVAPGTEVPLLRPAAGGLALDIARWGLVPHWWKDAHAPRLSHNARLEEAADKPMWRDALRRARCLLPVRGWYEWRERDRQPFYFFRRDGRLSAFAALFSWRREGERRALTCALLTTAAQGEAASVHHRMPVALAEAAQQAWLESGAVSVAADELAFHAVRKTVNAASAEGPELIEPQAA